MTVHDTPRRVLATAIEVVAVVAIAALVWQAMFGSEQSLDPMAFHVGALATIACLMAPGAARRVPWALAAYAALALLSAWKYGGLWVTPTFRTPIDSVPPYPVIIALLAFGIAHAFRTPLRIAAGTFALTGAVLVIGIQILYDRVRTGMVFERGGSESIPLVSQWGGLHQTGFLLVLALPPLMAIALLGRSIAQRLAGGMLAMIVMAIAFINGSRTGVAVMGVSALVMMVAVLFRRGTRERSWLVVPALLLTIIAAGVAGERINTRDGPIALTLKILSNDSPQPLAEKLTGDRWPIWQAATAVIRDNPLTGVGIRGYYRAMNEGGYANTYLPNHREVVHAGSVQAHNSVLHAAVEMGIPGGLCLVLLWGWMIWKPWRSSQEGWLTVVALGLAGAALACFLRLLADSFLDNVQAAERARVVVAMLFGLIIALDRSVRRVAVEQ